MKAEHKAQPEWREFEELVARIEADAGHQGLIITSPDRIRCMVTGRYREVDASIRARIGTSSLFITVECRKRKPKQDVTWIEQLATKKQNLGASRTIAVSASGFSEAANEVAHRHGIDLRRLSEVTSAEVNQLLKLDFVLFPHKRASLARVGIRLFKSLEWTMPTPDETDLFLPSCTDSRLPIFTNIETGATWSLNDLWLQLQVATDPFSGLPIDGKTAIRTACFPFPGNVTVKTPEGIKKLGDVILSVLLSYEVEQISWDAAKKVDYVGLDSLALQRVEFTSREPNIKNWRVSMQLPRPVTTLEELRTRIDDPVGGKA